MCACAPPAAAAQDLAATLEALRTRLAEAASEASAFAQLQQSASEPERLKRNSTQVLLCALLDCLLSFA